MQPKALLKRLTVYIETHLADDPYLGLPPAKDSRKPEVERLRRLFLSEAVTLRKYLVDAMKGHERLLDEAITILKRDTDEALREEANDIHHELIAVRRALYRLLLARQERNELVSEWNDWKRHAEFAGTQLQHAREEREEMLASELRLRGLRFAVTQERVTPTPEVAPVKEERARPKAEEVIEVPVRVEEPQADLLQDWDEVLAKFESSLPATEWEDVMEACLSPAAHPVSASAVIRRAKHHHGVQAKRKRHKKHPA